MVKNRVAWKILLNKVSIILYSVRVYNSAPIGKVISPFALLAIPLFLHHGIAHGVLESDVHLDPLDLKIDGVVAALYLQGLCLYRVDFNVPWVATGLGLDLGKP